ncbi:hypothetical protein VSR01_28205 [Actinacidiphila sp. DG2A-62]|uniref:hypothetical protein n=1 Tax=Actinacidiphila sp. DG2A-62 TaxID=3108821 RepID=UPI002DB73E9D|nr:hypothetical protein [Actinacidiphila sp. DG2A-62]MEC3997175.1 hypothetical protein [Actinacidiphila sp. DG2A-62]
MAFEQQEVRVVDPQLAVSGVGVVGGLEAAGVQAAVEVERRQGRRAGRSRVAGAWIGMLAAVCGGVQAVGGRLSRVAVGAVIVGSVGGMFLAAMKVLWSDEPG